MGQPSEARAEYAYDTWGNLKGTYDYYGNPITSPGHVGNINPIRYRGYFYDSETGFYYLQSRYYDPNIGRFINTDSQLNASLGVLGFNIFSYCMNNPVNMVDCGGNKPGDLFDTMDEAAKDFAEYINAKSIEEDREYASYIYRKVTVTVTAYTPITPWYLAIFGIKKKTCYKMVIKVQYSYVEPRRGTKTNVIGPMIGYILASKVALLHTHAAYDPEYSGDIFSSTDKNFADFLNVPFYVATPSGTLRKYNPADGSDIELYRDIPYDPNHPRR